MGGFLIFLAPFAVLAAALLVRRWIAHPADNPRDEGADGDETAGGMVLPLTADQSRRFDEADASMRDPRLVEIARKGRG